METTPTVPSYEEAVRFHGHCCPGLALGYRAAVEALAALEATRSEDEEIVAVVENDSCAVDAIQVVCGCTFGKGNLVFRDYGKRVYSIYSRARGRGVRVRTEYTGFAEDPGLAELRRRAAEGDDSEETRRAIEARTAAHIEAIVSGPVEAVLTIVPLDDVPPPTARIEPSEPCGRCGEPTMASRLQEVDGRKLCAPCRAAG